MGAQTEWQRLDEIFGVQRPNQATPRNHQMYRDRGVPTISGIRLQISRTSSRSWWAVKSLVEEKLPARLFSGREQERTLLAHFSQSNSNIDNDLHFVVNAKKNIEWLLEELSAALSRAQKAEAQLPAILVREYQAQQGVELVQGMLAAACHQRDQALSELLKSATISAQDYMERSMLKPRPTIIGKAD